MKKLLFLSLFFILSLNVFAQEWITDLSEAKKIASKENKTIVLVFQGSDWCAPCIKLDREIWSTDEFKAYAKDHYVMLQADFPRSKKNKLSKEQQAKNNKLAEKYNKNGYFPFVVVLDKNGKVLEETGYLKTTPSKYIDQLNTSLK
jgi:thioredoxin-related protein